MELPSGSRETMRRGGELWEGARRGKSLWILFHFYLQYILNVSIIYSVYPVYLQYIQYISSISSISSISPIYPVHLQYIQYISSISSTSPVYPVYLYYIQYISSISSTLQYILEMQSFVVNENNFTSINQTINSLSTWSCLN